MGKILSRIKEIADKEGLTIGAFERCIGASKGVLSRALANNTDIQAKWLEIVVENYPQYSTRWLLTGEGDMLRPSAVGEPEPREAMPLATTPAPQPQFESLIATIREQAEEIGRLKARIDMLERRPDAAPIG